MQRRQIGDEVPIELLRDGRTIRAALRLDRRVGAGSLVPGPLYGERPRYFIFGGLAFCPVTVNYAQAWGEDWWNRAPRHLLALLGRPARFEGDEPVVVCGVLHAEVNSGYEEISEDLVVKADGQAIRTLRHLVQIVESRDSGLLVLETQEDKQVVLDRERARREGPAILARYQVAGDRSEDLVATAADGRAVATSVAGEPPGYSPVP